MTYNLVVKAQNGASKRQYINLKDMEWHSITELLEEEAQKCITKI
jgi:hypothetical protein